MRHHTLTFGFLLMSAISAGCVSVPNEPGRPSTYVDPRESQISSVEIASEDVMRATDDMVADILATPGIVKAGVAPRIVLDSAAFHNESCDDVNKHMFTDRLRVQLQRAANGRLVILGRHYASLGKAEREEEQQGAVTPGAEGQTGQTLGYDYRLGGRIASLYNHDGCGRTTAYYQVTFELFRRGTLELVWSKQYEFKKMAQESILYR